MHARSSGAEAYRQDLQVATPLGIINPGEANLGIIPDVAFKKGKRGTVSRFGSLTYYVVDTPTRTDYDEST